MDHEQAQRIVYETIDIVNQQLPAARRLRKSPGTVIVGPGGALDSLGVVTFVITLEDKVGEAIGANVQLLERDLLGEGSPLQTVAALTELVATAGRS
jgi:acyl carrier protein